MFPNGLAPLGKKKYFKNVEITEGVSMIEETVSNRSYACLTVGGDHELSRPSYYGPRI